MLDIGMNLINNTFRSLPVCFSAEQSIVASFGLIYASKVAQIGLTKFFGFTYDNVQASFRYGAKSDSWEEKTIQRAYNAHLNSWEAFTGFSVAMLMALQLTSPYQKPELDMLGNAFVFVRGAYIISYILAWNRPLAVVRSILFSVGMISIGKLFGLALINKK